MFGCHRPVNAPQPDGSSTENISTQEGKSGGWYKAAVLGGAIAFGPHALCVLGLGGLVGVGGFSIHQLCGHRDSQADSSRGIEIRRLDKVPDDYVKFPELRAAVACEALIAAEPRFAEVIEAKRIEAEGKSIQIVFIESDDKVQVVICKEGAMCPCSKPQAYDMGSREDIIGAEKFPGQRNVLNALYGELDSVRTKIH